MDPGFGTGLGWPGKEFGFDEGPADAVGAGVLGSAVDAGAADDDEIVPACDVGVGTGSKRPETGCNIRGGSQRPDIPAVQLDQAGSNCKKSLRGLILEDCKDRMSYIEAREYQVVPIPVRPHQCSHQ